MSALAGPPRGSERPPRGSEMLARIATPRDDRDLLLADLRERFCALVRERGAPAARGWYRRQALRAVATRLVPDADLWSRRSWRGLAGDVRQSVRRLARRPLYTLGVAGTLALGLASAATVLTVAWHVWLAPLPFPDPGRVVRLYELGPVDGAERTSSVTGADVDGRQRWRLSPPLLEDLRAHDWATVQRVGGVSRNVYEWARDGRVSRLTAVVASPELFEILAISPVAGRVLSPDPDAAEVVLTESFWERVYGRDPTAIGGTLVLSGRPHTVVGVVELPSAYPPEGEVIVRMSFGEEQLVTGMRGARYLDVVARIDPGYGVEDARAEMGRIVEALGTQHANHAGWSGTAVPLADELIAPYRGVMGLLVAAGVVFLLLAVVNVAGLTAARTLEGAADRAVRLALGASEGRLLRGASVESVMLGTFAGAVGLAVAYAILGPVTSLVPADVPRIDDVRLDVGLAATIVGVAMACGALVGVLGYGLSRGARRDGPGARRRSVPGTTARAALVVGQIALTTLLVTTGGGVLRHIDDMRSVDIGFRPEGVTASQVILSGQRYSGPAERVTYWRAVTEAARSRGLEVAVGTNAPMAGVNMPWGFRVDPTSEQIFAQYHPVSEGYFRVLGIDVVEGRTFTDEDREGSERVVVVNEALARARFGGESPVGRTMRLLDEDVRIVGVVRATRHFGPGGEVPEEIYAPMPHDPWPHAQVLARGPDAAVAAATLTDALTEVDPGLEVPRPAPYEQYVAGWYATLRLQAVIVGILAVVGTLLATLGLYALVAYQVGMRRREIGVRMALGASATRTFSDVVRRGVGLAALGIALGFVVWYAAIPAARSILGDVEYADPLLPVAVVVLVGLVSLAASALPARRSVALDPAVTLRSE